MTDPASGATYPDGPASCRGGGRPTRETRHHLLDHVQAPAPLTAGPGVLAPGPRRRRAPGRLSICLYTPSYDPSGMGGHMLDLAAAFRRDHEVTLMAWPTAGGQRLLDGARALGVRTVALPRPRDPDFGPAVTRALHAHPADVFHVHVGTGREDFDGARAARAAGTPLVLQTLHLPWRLGSRKHRVPLLRSLEAVDHVVTVSAGQRRTYERAGVTAQGTSTIPNGIRPRSATLGRAAARQALGLTPDQPVVLTTGRLTVMKGHRYLVEAAAALAPVVDDLAVVVLGDGHLRARLEDQIAALGVQHVVRLAGHRPDARLLLDAADVFVLPSLHEGMPLSLLEAMEAGLPAVATRVIGSEEVVVHGETGLLVPPRRPADLAAALLQALQGDAERARWGRAGRDRYLRRFTAARMAAETRELYEALLARGDPRVPAAVGR